MGESGLVRGEWHPSRPVAAKWAMGRSKPGTALWTTGAAPVLLADSAVEILRHEGLTGWDVYPVDLRNRSGAAIGGYLGLIITGRCGPVDDSRSKMIPRAFPGGTFPVRTGVFFDDRTWDGSDFFMPPLGCDLKFTTKRVVEAFGRAKVKNVDFTPLPEVEMFLL